jgi:hypothetical protein
VWNLTASLLVGGRGVCFRAFLARPKKSKKLSFSNEMCQNVILGRPTKAHPILKFMV